MVLRVNDVSYKKGAFKRNFKKAELGNTYASQKRCRG